MMSFKISKDIVSDEWNKNLKKSEYSNFFQTAEYLYSHSDSKKKFPIFINIYDELGNVVGQLGIIIQKSPFIYSAKFLNPLLKIASLLGSRGTWTSGPIVHSKDKKMKMEILRTMIDALEKVSEENNLLIIDGYTSPQDRDINIEQFKNKNFAKIDYITYVLNLNKNEEEIWGGFSQSAKRDIIKAQKNKIHVKELEEKDLDDFFNLSEIWAKTKGVDKSSNENMKKKYWDYYTKNIEKVFLAFEDGILTSSHRLGCFNGIVYSHSIVNSYLKRDSVSGSLLIWHAIQWAKKIGMRSYDFSGGKSPKNSLMDNIYEKQWNSLMAYKRKWGGEEIPYFHLSLIRKKRLYKIIRGFLKIDWIFREIKKNNYKR